MRIGNLNKKDKLFSDILFVTTTLHRHTRTGCQVIWGWRIHRLHLWRGV